MFFRREKVKVPTFQERLDQLGKAGFASERLPDGRVQISKHGVAAVVGDAGQNQFVLERAGVVLGGQIATLLNGGYQMFLETPGGKRYPAQAEQLRALHQFEDDVRQALSLTNLYNTSLGTTSPKHQYDRVNKRDSGKQPKPWENKEHRIVGPETKSSQPI